MNLSDKILELETYTYNDYKLWEGDWELIKGHPQAMSPSPKYVHQKFSQNFSRTAGNALINCNKACSCEVLYELDWLINDDTIVRPDCMIVCGNIENDYLTFPPNLILEISSPATRMKDRNTKYNLYEMCGVKYYIIADPDKKSVEVFELINNEYISILTTTFLLTPQCSIELDVFNLW
jgi:Uma2 family endonuclease